MKDLSNIKKTFFVEVVPLAEGNTFIWSGRDSNALLSSSPRIIMFELSGIKSSSKDSPAKCPNTYRNSKKFLVKKGTLSISWLEDGDDWLIESLSCEVKSELAESFN